MVDIWKKIEYTLCRHIFLEEQMHELKPYEMSTETAYGELLRAMLAFRMRQQELDGCNLKERKGDPQFITYVDNRLKKKLTLTLDVLVRDVEVELEFACGSTITFAWEKGCDVIITKEAEDSSEEFLEFVPELCAMKPTDRMLLVSGVTKKLLNHIANRFFTQTLCSTHV
jgi:hypothetical protein